MESVTFIQPQIKYVETTCEAIITCHRQIVQFKIERYDQYTINLMYDTYTHSYIMC